MKNNIKIIKKFIAVAIPKSMEKKCKHLEPVTHFEVECSQCNEECFICSVVYARAKEEEKTEYYCYYCMKKELKKEGKHFLEVLE